MTWKPLSPSNRLLPFRNACGSSNRTNLLDRLQNFNQLQSRPKVAEVPPTATGSVEEQDAVLSGMTRSLHRRLSALNLPTMNSVTGQRRVA
ncbi:hypothetical protein GCM10022270_16760 [Terriglobus aquaticus]